MKVLNSYGITKKENGVENVRNSKVSQEEDKLIQQKLQEAFGYTDEQRNNRNAGIALAEFR